MATGLVHWDGSVLEDRPQFHQNRDTARLRLQLLNGDPASTSRVRESIPLENST